MVFLRVGLFLLFVFLGGCSYTIDLQGKLDHPRTKDGWDLTLEHFVPDSGIRKKYPVILCHGLGANRNYYKLNEQDSAVSILLEEGYEVFLLDLRGRYSAGSPGFLFGEKTYTYNFDDYVKYDMDTAITEVLERTGKKKVNWIGHSMGGMIAYARIGSLGEDRVANLVTIGSPFSFPEPSKTLKFANSMSFLTYVLPAIPVRRMARIKAGIRIPIFPDGKVMNLIYWEENVDAKVNRGLKLVSVNDISIPEIRQFSRWVERASITDNEGKINYTENLKNIKIPTLLVWGTRDNLAPGYVVRDVYERLGSGEKEIRILGRSQGHSEDYGHTDLIIGKKAGQEVFLPISLWLNRHNEL